MKQTLTRFFLIGLPFASHAQFTLNSDEMMPFGHTVQMRILASFDLIDTTVQGNNAHWDFTALSQDLDQAAFSVTAMDPADTPNGASFPTANFTWREMPSNTYRYFTLTPEKMERVGSYSTSPYIMADPQVEYVFPLTLGTTNVDEWQGVWDGGEYRLNCVGSGVLDLPGHSYDEVLMVRVKVNGLSYVTDAYFWYDATNGAILVQYIPGDDGVVGESGLFATGLAADVADQGPLPSIVMDNPVTEVLRVTSTFPNVATYRILSSTGALVRSGRSGAGGAVMELPVSDLTPGIYLLDLRTAIGNEPLALARFVKQ